MKQTQTTVRLASFHCWCIDHSNTFFRSCVKRRLVLTTRYTLPVLFNQQREFCNTRLNFNKKGHYRSTRVASEDAIDPLTKPPSIDKSALHVVSVPIGNLKDFSYRALEVLREVDYIITSDRPATKMLLDLVHIPTQGRLIHYSKHNQSATCDKLVDLLKGGRSMALVTTSGTPCVGDVGSELVAEMQLNGIRVTSVPGPSAVLSALVMCGLTFSPHESKSHSNVSSSYQEAAATATATTTRNNVSHLSEFDGCELQLQQEQGKLSGLQNTGSINDSRNISMIATKMSCNNGSFYFGNFLPSSHGARLRILRNIVGPAHYPCVFYEIPRRLLLILQDIAAVLPRRRVYVAHELTKLNESLHADTIEKLVQHYLRHEANMLLRKGQIVLVIAGAGPEETIAWIERQAARRRRLRRSISEIVTQTSTTKDNVKPTHNRNRTRKRKITHHARRANRVKNNTSPTCTGAETNTILCETKGLVQQKGTKKLTTRKNSKRSHYSPHPRRRREQQQQQRRARLCRRREELIQQIEKEQEKLQLQLQINANDANQV